MERRKARAPDRKGAGLLKGGRTEDVAPSGAPSPHFAEGAKKQRRSPRVATSGRRSVGCLTIEEIVNEGVATVARKTID